MSMLDLLKFYVLMTFFSEVKFRHIRSLDISKSSFLNAAINHWNSKKLEFGFGSKKTQDPDIRAKIFGLKYVLLSIQISK